MRRVILISLLILFIIASGYYFWPEKKLPVGNAITKLIVYKSENKLLAYSGETLLKTYTVSLGHNPTGDKVFEGDNKTPEGNYTINAKNPKSTCYKNLGISYPNSADIDEAKRLGRSPGGDIKIHGLPNGQGLIGKFHRFKNWTNGCIGVTNTEMDELYGSVAIGTPIIIKP